MPMHQTELSSQISISGRGGFFEFLQSLRSLLGLAIGIWSFARA
jgi:hypothetical protein